MEKQIETVYVGTMEDTTLHLAKRKGEWNALNSSMNLCHSLKEVRAYLYTPEEHQAVQGYREALERIRLITHYKAIQNDNMEMIIHSANQIAQQALSNSKND